MLEDKRILLGITGGIAAYKSVYLLRELQKAGAQVRVTLTPSALHFIGRETFSALTKHEVGIHVFNEGKNGTANSWTKHISWGSWADIFVIAPCTANTLSKIAAGLSDNMLTATVLAARCPLLICPTMDGDMYESPAIRTNLKKLKSFGYTIMEPEKGFLASGLEGKGRLPEISSICDRIQHVLSQHRTKSTKLLADKTIVITGGPTREYIDAVRFISNPSSGKMGLALAKAAHQLGADVTFVHGPIALGIPEYLNSIAVQTASEMFDAVQKNKRADGIIMAAAVSDFTPQSRADHKIKKENAHKTLQLESTQDILAWLGEHRDRANAISKSKSKNSGQILVGFAMETENLIENARKKLHKKKIDWIAANTIKNGKGFQSDYNEIYLINENSKIALKGRKTDIAEKMLHHIFGK